MSRINTNVSSLVAQNSLARSNNDLQTALNRLSTGLRINQGKDDPAGLIASELLRRDITSIEKAITNSERANQLIATADSALGQVSSLLNDIRGLVTEAANSGAQSQEQIAANQLQVDSSLEAIDRISQTTTFQGRKLLDGSLGFLVSGGSGFNTVKDLQIQQANLGSAGSVDVAVTISQAASKAKISNSIPSSSTGQFTIGGSSFSIKTTATSNLSSVTVAVDALSGPEARGSFTVDGHKFNVTAASGQAGIDNVTVTTAKADLAARGTVKIDGTDFYIEAATGTNFDNTTVEIAKTDLGLAKSATGSDVQIRNGANGVDFDIEVSGSIANLSTKDNVEIVVTNVNTGTGDTADYDVSANQLVINIDAGTAGVRTTGALETLIENATVDGANVGQTFSIGTIANVGTGVAAAGPFTVANEFLLQDQAQASFSAGTNKLTITLNSNAEATVTAAEIDAEITALSEFTTVTPTGASNVTVSGVTAGDTGVKLLRPGVLAGYVDGAPDTLTLTFDSGQSVVNISEVIAAIDGLAEFSGTTSTSTSGSINGTNFTTGSTASALNRLTTGVAAAFDTNSNTLTLSIDQSNAAITAASVVSAIDGLSTYFENTATTGNTSINGANVTSNANLATAAQVQDLVVRISGSLGSEVFQFKAGATFQQIADAVSLVSDSIGVTGSINGSTLEFDSTKYGSNAFVDVEVLSEGSGGTFETNLSSKRQTGTDVLARVNGVEIQGNGNSISVNTSTLDISLTVDAGSSTSINFSINGGGAVFQLGPEVVTAQQARIGIDSISTGKLGGAAGYLYELRSGNAKALATDANGAAAIIDEVITGVTQLRGRLGAFQRTTLESNLVSLNDAISNLTEAQSSIRDADFAKESARLTRAQILVQSGTSVLAIANQNPQNVLALLR